MKILHIAKFYPPVPGGIENFVFDLANAQVRQGHDVSVLSHQTDVATPTFTETIHGVTVIRVRTFGQMAYAPITPEFSVNLFRTIRRFKPDIIHAHLPNISAFWLLFIKKTCPFIIHWHADVVPSKIDRKMAFLYTFYKPWETALLKKSDAVIATSRPYLDFSAPLCQFREKCHVIPLGLDPNRLKIKESSSSADTRSHNPNFDLTVLSVGRFTYYKGFEYLVTAAEKTPRVRFIIVGNGPEYPMIKQIVNKKKLYNRISLPGSTDRERLIRLFQSCDVFCLPSIERTEAFGLVLLEAMYFEKPLITTEIKGSGVCDVNQHGKTGIQIPPENAKALADSIFFMQNNPKRRVEMGTMGRQKLNDSMNIQIISGKIDTLYTMTR